MLRLRYDVIAAFGALAGAFSCWVATWPTWNGYELKQWSLAASSSAFAIVWLSGPPLHNSRRVASAWLVLPSLAVLLAIRSIERTVPFDQIVLISTSVLLPPLLILARWFARRTVAQRLTGAFALGLLLWGVRMLYLSATRIVHGHHWSDFNVPLGLKARDAMTNHQALAMSGAYLLAAALVGLVAMFSGAASRKARRAGSR